MATLNRLYERTRPAALSARVKALAMLALLLALGAAFSLLNVPLAASAANGVEVVHTDQAVPKDPQSPMWANVKEVEIPLSAQQMYQPGGGTTRFVRVRALEDGHNFAIMVSWDDDTRNDMVGNMPSDAAAIQLPIDPSNIPYQCMGQSTSRVNIWQWKAALEKEGLENSGVVDYSGAGTRNLTSNGICKAVDTPGIDPQARSFWDGKMWHVVYYRAMSKGDIGSAPVSPDTTSSIAFAVWNGARGETRGMKAVSTWNTLTFQTPQQSPTGGLVTLAIVVALSVGAVAFAMRRLAG